MRLEKCNLNFNQSLKFFAREVGMIQKKISSKRLSLNRKEIEIGQLVD